MDLAQNREHKFVSAVMYLHNDAAYIDMFLSMITQELAALFDKYELIFVNDASSDDGIAKIYDFFEHTKMDSQMVSIIQMSNYQGQEAAMNAGRDLAIGDFVFEFDNLFIDYPKTLIRKIYERTLEGYDVVAAGCRDGMRFTSRMFYSVFNRNSGSEGKIGPETFRILSRRAVNRIKSIGDYIPYRKAIYMNCGLRADVIEYHAIDIDARRKALKGRHERTHLALDSLIYFTDVMEKVSTVISALFVVISLLMGIEIIREFCMKTQAVSGWLSTMGFMSLSFMGVFILLSIIMKYLSVILKLMYRKQRYLIAGVEKIAPKQ